MDKEKEIQCLKKLAEGDYQSYELLFLFYHPKIYHFLCGFIKNEEEALDIAQDIFYKIWAIRESLKEVISFRSYLFSMARHHLYNYYRSNLVKEKYYLSQLGEQAEEYTIDDELFAKDLALLIDLVVEQMPKQRQMVFKMSRSDGLANEEIATRLGLTKRTVENHITNALRDIRKALEHVICFMFM